MSLNNLTVWKKDIVPKGRYNKVRIIGRKNFFSGVQANSISIYGNTSLNNPDFKFLKSFGTTEFQGPVSGTSIRIRGLLKTLSRIQSDDLLIKGTLKAKEGVESKRIVNRGKVETNYLQGDHVSIFLSGNSTASKIKAQTVNVTIQKALNPLAAVIKNLKPVLRAETIEAEKIHLEYTFAQAVRGKDVYIGRESAIDLVEFENSVWIDKNARVKRTIQIQGRN